MLEKEETGGPARIEITALETIRELILDRFERSNTWRQEKDGNYKKRLILLTDNGETVGEIALAVSFRQGEGLDLDAHKIMEKLGGEVFLVQKDET